MVDVRNSSRRAWTAYAIRDRRWVHCATSDVLNARCPVPGARCPVGTQRKAATGAFNLTRGTPSQAPHSLRQGSATIAERSRLALGKSSETDR